VGIGNKPLDCIFYGKGVWGGGKTKKGTKKGLTAMKL
jgi:hypothetical protein